IGAETRAVEDAVMPDAFLQEMQFLVGGKRRAEIMRGFGLADTRNVVALALDGHECRLTDRRGIDLLAAMVEQPARQLVIDENLLDRLQIELGGQIHPREI